MANPPTHSARVLGTPCRGVYSTDITSARHFGRHWHDTYGFGVLEQGAHSSASGRGEVQAFAGHVITTNPGEVHDGRPLGGPTRRWRIVYIETDVMAALTSQHRTDVAITRPVIEDVRLMRALRRLFRRIERWHAAPTAQGVDALACEESLVESGVLLMSRHGTSPLAVNVPHADMRRVRERLGDSLCDPPSLADLAAMIGLSKYQVLRRFVAAYGVPPHAWLLRARAERARALIRDGMSLPAAAIASGFADQSHMTRIFVRQYGFTPGAWQKASALQ